MCDFFSLISNGKGKIRYFDKDIRQQIRDGKISYSEDSHDSIGDYFRREIPVDKANKYEYNPFTKKFIIDQLNAVDYNEGFILDDSRQVEEFCKKLDFNKVVPNWGYTKDIYTRLQKYKFINPIKATKMPDEKRLRRILVDIEGSVRDSIRSNPWNSVRNSVKNPVKNPVVGPIWDSVWNSFWDSVWNSVGDSILGSVCDSIWGSIWNQCYVCEYYAVNKFMKLNINHPAFELVKLGVIVITTIEGMVKVYGKNGMFLGEFKE